MSRFVLSSGLKAKFLLAGVMAFGGLRAFAAQVDGAVQLWANGPYWADRNVGATQPEESGLYFWWGDTVGYKRNAADDGWVSSKDGKTAIQFYYSSALAKSTSGKDNATLIAEGWIDASGNLTMAHDAARANLGGDWRLPTAAEIGALVANTTSTPTNRNGVAGVLFAGANGKSVFLPATGCGFGSSLNHFGSLGLCWSSTSKADDCDCAWRLLFDLNNFRKKGYNDRHYGYPVRPVRSAE